MYSRLETKYDLSVLVNNEGRRIIDDGEKCNLLCDVFEESHRNGGASLPVSNLCIVRKIL